MPSIPADLPSRGFARFFAWVLIVFGAFLLLGVFLPSETPETQEATAPMAVFAVVMLAGGTFWLSRIKTARRRAMELREEKTVIGVAAAHDGHVTIAQIALETDLSMESAEAVLARLCSRSVAQPDLEEDGSVVYHIATLSRRTSRERLDGLELS